MNKKITVFTTVHPYFDNRIFFKQIKSLLKKYDVEYFAQINDDVKADLGENKGFLKINLFKRHRGRLKRILKGYQLIPSLLKTHADLFIFHDFELLPIGIILKMFRKKVIFDMHEDFISKSDTVEWLPNFSRKIIKFFCYSLQKIGMRIFDFWFLAEDPYKIYFQNTKTQHHVIHNYPITNINITPQNRISNSMVYVGSITQNRGLWRMVKLTEELMKNSNDIKLHLIGIFGSEKLKQEFNDYIRKNNLEKNVIYHGIIPNKDIYDFINQFSIGLILLDYEKNFERALPTKMFEYMLCRIPVITTDIKTWKDIIEDANGGYAVNSDNIEEQLKACKKLFSNPELIESLGNNGFNAVKEKYSWEAEEKIFLSTIDNILN